MINFSIKQIHVFSRDKLFKQYGKDLYPNSEFKMILDNTKGFEGLKLGKGGFSIKFKPASTN